MHAGHSRRAWLLLAPLAFVWGCSEPPLPPGGTAAVEYWHRILQEHPDLPQRVRTVVNGGGWTPFYSTDFPATTDIRIYSEQGEVAFSGSRIELLITDLDTAALKQLLAVWEAIPEQAAELGLSARPIAPPRRGARSSCWGVTGASISVGPATTTRNRSASSRMKPRHRR